MKTIILLLSLFCAASVFAQAHTGSVIHSGLPPGILVIDTTASHSGEIMIDTALKFIKGISVTSVALAGGNGVSILNSPITHYGTITVGITNLSLSDTSLAANCVTTTKILNANITLAKLANINTLTLLGNNTGSPATPVALTASQVKTLLAIANTDVSGLGTLSTKSVVDLSGADATGTLAAARFPAMTGDITNSAGSLTTTVSSIQNKAVSLSAGYLKYTGSAWTSDNSTFLTSISIGTPLNASPGAILFGGSSRQIQMDSTNLVWDDVNNYLKVGKQGTTFAHSIINIVDSINSYLQVNLQNTSPGTSASTDYIATANNGTDSTHYIDMGINSSTYAQTGFSGVKPNDTYLYGTGGNLVIGSATDSTILQSGGNNIANRAAIIDRTGILTLTKYATGALSTSAAGVVTAGVLSTVNGGTASGWILAGKLGSDVVISSTSLTDIAGLSYVAVASTTYEIDVWIDASVGAVTTGTQFGVNSTGGSPGVFINVNGLGTAFTQVTTAASANNAATGTTLVALSEEGFIHITGIVKSGTGTPTISIRTLKLVSGSVTIKAGSKFLIRPQ